MKRLLIIVSTVLVIASVSSLFLVINSLRGVDYPLPTSAQLDHQLGGQWRVVAEAQLHDVSNASPIIVGLARNSLASYFASYAGENQTLAIFLFKYQDENYTDTLLNKVMVVYEELNWSLRQLNVTQGFYASSPHAQYVFAGHRDWIIVIYVGGNQLSPSESMRVLLLELNETS